MSKLPPITSGGGRWSNKLTTLCHGTVLALGDIRCLLGQILTNAQVKDFEQNADITTYDNDTAYTTVSTAIGRALRAQFPTPPTVYQNIKFKIKPDETGAAYYFRCAAEWEQLVEENSINNPVTRDVFRSAVMAGAPPGVKQIMENNPDIPIANNDTWERHLVYHTDRAIDKTNKDLAEVDKLKNELLKLQLEQAKQANTKKKQMPQQAQPITTTATPHAPQPNQYPNPYPYGPQDPYTGPPYMGNPWGGYQQNRGGPRGRGGPNRGGYGAFGRNACYVCGQEGHWGRNCPNIWSQPQNSGASPLNGPPAGGWGPRGGGAGRGAGDYGRGSPTQHNLPQLNLMAPMHPTWGQWGGADE
ncbi:uncharacterized protein [Misgurnus anguillicaudatus]|uniref:uncharacterized protein n=1 Tax=Misgurnus anguillicaudatus TaxID=75329 RepID=UPI003CCFB762